MNRALSLASRCFFMERGTIRFDGPTAELSSATTSCVPSSWAPRRRARLTMLPLLALSAPSGIVLQGAIIGLGYGLLAVGLVLIYRTNRIINFAQGQVGVIAAVFLVKLTADFHFEYSFSLVLSIGLAAGVGALRAGAPPALRPGPCPPDGGHDRAESGAARPHRAALHPAQEPVRTRPRALRRLLLHRDGDLHPGAGAHHHRRPIVAIALAVAVRSTNLGPLHACHVGERRLGAPLGRVDPAHLDLDVDRGGACPPSTPSSTPRPTSALTQELSPDLLLFALTAALIGAMVNLTVAFVAGIGVGIFYELLQWNTLSSNTQRPSTWRSSTR